MGKMDGRGAVTTVARMMTPPAERGRRPFAADFLDRARACYHDLARPAGTQEAVTMDERTWLNSINLQEMLTHLRQTASVHRKKVGRRKLRLLACACARAVWARMSEPCRRLVEGVELLVDGRLAQEEYDARARAVQEHFMNQRFGMRPGNADGIVFAVMGTQSLEQMVLVASSQLSLMSGEMESIFLGTADPSQMGESLLRAIEESGRRGAELAREVFGNPFRPLPARKFPAEACGLAEACYDDPANYPVLADALADLGEEQAAEHCRRPQHVRGCHVVDWVLGKG
jgi:hypothetical protein